MSNLFRDVEGAPLCPEGSVVCIGAFDGLHLGHRALIDRVIAHAREKHLKAVCLSFEPLPREYFGQNDPPPRITLPRMKLEALRSTGLDKVGLLRFGPSLASMSAEDFVDHFLVNRLHAKEVWVGEDFRFGKGRRGDLSMLQSLGKQYGFTANSIAPIVHDGERISASAIREHLLRGELEIAARLLGRPYAIAGRVVRGKQLGRKLGYPTANLRFHGKKPALSGIYATWVHGVGSKPWPSVSSLGTRPTVDGSEPLLEAHLFDFNGDLYSRRIEIEFVAKLRDELKFDSLDALIAQMNLDAARARLVLFQQDDVLPGVSA